MRCSLFFIFRVSELFMFNVVFFLFATCFCGRNKWKSAKKINFKESIKHLNLIENFIITPLKSARFYNKKARKYYLRRSFHEFEALSINKNILQRGNEIKRSIAAWRTAFKRASNMFWIISTALIALFTSLGRTLKIFLKIAVETF